MTAPCMGTVPMVVTDMFMLRIRREQRRLSQAARAARVRGRWMETSAMEYAKIRAI